MSSGKNLAGKGIPVTTPTFETPMGMDIGTYGKVYLEGHPLMDAQLKQSGIETHAFLGDSGLKVSRICLGTMNFGTLDKTYGDRPGQLSDSEAHKVLDKFVELGGNFIDTSNFYPWFGKCVGEAEKIIGTWLAK